MKATDYLAIWGAVVATAVAAWNIYKDVFRDRVKVSARYMVVMPGRKDVFTFDVTNLTSHKIRVTNCGGYSKRAIHNLTLRRLLRRFYPMPGSGFIFLTRNDVGTSIPAVIDPWDQATFCFNAENLPVMEELCAITADGRNWYVPRADIKAIQEHRLYKAARAADPLA